MVIKAINGYESNSPAEHQRLQLAVVVAAKRRATTPYKDFETFVTVDIAFDEAVDALIAFEAEHGIDGGGH